MKALIIAATAGTLALSGCAGMTAGERTVAGGAAGAAGGLVLANALGANPNWTILATLGGAAAGAVVARNATENECAYADGRGGYYTAPC
ncbi:glycine zipper 2TM domain-containing protein [Pararhodobacter oceanensis]|uniref:glycine zipper 2TM domain-containing protein n=1 Tax=Pararhodobacter oceanensis TaxID=2172121 RepID=UPI003A91D6BC